MPTTENHNMHISEPTHATEATICSYNAATNAHRSITMIQLMATAAAATEAATYLTCKMDNFLASVRNWPAYRSIDNGHPPCRPAVLVNCCRCSFLFLSSFFRRLLISEIALPIITKLCDMLTVARICKFLGGYFPSPAPKNGGPNISHFGTIFCLTFI